ncbi:MAG TPA: hypothetical protein PKD37_06265 [Oligoflexia bacterium]|nr:hypothetical protein [Oligoflexia bacterium]HMP27566.1 hypothetical protein [Oligoflexia bacterium]
MLFFSYIYSYESFADQSSRFSKCVLFIPLVISLIFINGCVKTPIQYNSVISKEELNSFINKGGYRPLNFIYNGNRNFSKIGNQFLLIALPFGAIQINDLENEIKTALATELLEKGFSIAENDEQLLDAIEITPLKITVSAYDLLLARKLECQTAFEMRLLKTNGEEVNKTKSSVKLSQFRIYGFSKELSQIFSQCLTTSLRQGLNDLNLTR